jgi:hypothetical protein
VNRSSGKRPDVPTILRKLPFYEDQRTLRVPGGPAVTIKHHQIILWVSVTRPHAPGLPVNAGRFPAVLDTGFNDNFLLQEEHLVRWAGLAPQDLPQVDFLAAAGQRIPLHDADVWLHPNRPGFRDQFSGAPPFCLELDSGIGVWPSGLPGARRLPLLRLRGLRRADLQLWIDCQKCQVWLRTPRRFWFFG